MRAEVFFQLWWLPAPVQASHPNDQSPRSESLLCKWLVWHALIVWAPSHPASSQKSVCLIMSRIFIFPRWSLSPHSSSVTSEVRELSTSRLWVMVSRDFSLFYYLSTPWLGGGVGWGGSSWDKEIGQQSAAGGTGRCLLWAAGVSLSGVCTRAWPLGSVQAQRGSGALTEVWSGPGQQRIINLARVTMGAAGAPL